MDVDEFWQNVRDTSPDKLPNLSPKRLDALYAYFSDSRLELYGRDQKFLDAAQNRLAELKDEKQRRRDEKRDKESKARHKQTQKLTRIAIALSGLGVAVGIGKCIVDKPNANTPRSTPQLQQSSPSATTPPTNPNDISTPMRSVEPKASPS